MTGKLIYTRRFSEYEYHVYAYNDALIGRFYREVDGYYVFVPKGSTGYWPAHMMRALADELDSLNKEWDEIVQKELIG